MMEITQNLEISHIWLQISFLPLTNLYSWMNTFISKTSVTTLKAPHSNNICIAVVRVHWGHPGSLALVELS